MGGYYESREVRPDSYEQQRDTSNLRRYGTIRRTNGPPVSHPSERTYPELRRVRQYDDSSRVHQYQEEDYGAAGIDVSSYGGGFPPSSYLAPAPTHHRSPYGTTSRRSSHVTSSGALPGRSSSQRSMSRGPVVDLSSLAGDFRPYNTPFDGFERRPPPLDYQLDELDLLGSSSARRPRYASPARGPSRTSRGADLPTPGQFAAMTPSRNDQYPPGYGYGGYQQPFPGERGPRW